MKLLQQIVETKVNNTVQNDLKNAHDSDAGTYDVVDKATQTGDIAFSAMRNAINTAGGNISGSDVSKYINRAEELNDEVDTVAFGLETNTGEIVKVYVAAEQADDFEAAMKNVLGLEDDIQEAINRLASEFDIIDVVWPQDSQNTSTLDSTDQDAQQAADVLDASDDDNNPNQTQNNTAGDITGSDFIGTDGDGNAIQPTGNQSGDFMPGSEKESQEDGAGEGFDSVGNFPLDSVDAEDDDPEYEAGAEGDGFADDSLSPEEEAEEDNVELIKKKKAPKIKKEESNPMKLSTGNRFAARVKTLKEAEEIDAVGTSLAGKMKLPIEKKLVSLTGLLGIPGRYLNNDDGISGLRTGAEKLRRGVSARHAFDKFYSAVESSVGNEAFVEESIGSSRLAKMLAGVLIELGVPADIVLHGPTPVNSALRRMAHAVEQDEELSNSLKLLALRLGISVSDLEKQLDGEITEAIDVGDDQFAQEVVKLAGQLGIPEDILNLRRSQLVQSLRKTKSHLQGRNQILIQMKRLSDLLSRNTTNTEQAED